MRELFNDYSQAYRRFYGMLVLRNNSGNGGEMNEFNSWLEQTADIRARLMEYGKTGKPSTDEGAALDSLVAIDMTDEAARLRAEAEKHLSHQRELAMWAIRKESPDLTSREREIVERSRVREVQLMVDACDVTYKSCLSRYFNYKGNR